MPGAGKQSPQTQAQIQELLEAGFDPTTIHRRLKVGRSSIYRMKRCLAQHGTAYMPPSLNKKNGRPKVLGAEQELEVREWLRDPANRTRFLDDLVWMIHDRFGIVCSTTTMSKLKRKWLRVIEYEETGRRLDVATWEALRETHPELEILGKEGAMPRTDEHDDFDDDGGATERTLDERVGHFSMSRQGYPAPSAAAMMSAPVPTSAYASPAAYAIYQASEDPTDQDSRPQLSAMGVSRL